MWGALAPPGTADYPGAMTKPLSRKEEWFCQHYAGHGDGAKAYRYAFCVRPGTKLHTQQNEAGKLLSDERVRLRIEHIRAYGLALSGATKDLTNVHRVLEDTINSDPSEAVRVWYGACRYCWGSGHNYQWYEEDYMDGLAQAERDHKPLPEWKGGVGYQNFVAPHPECPRCGGRGEEHSDIVPPHHMTEATRRSITKIEIDKDGGVKFHFADKNKAIDQKLKLTGHGPNSGLGDEIARGIAGAAAAAISATVDPHEAARLYAEFLKAKPVPMVDGGVKSPQP